MLMYGKSTLTNYSAPLEVLLDNVTVAKAMHGNSPEHEQIFCRVAIMFDLENSRTMWRDYVASNGFSELHHTLLFPKVDAVGELREHLMNLGSLQSIDAPDGKGRSALAWATEFLWADAVDCLLSFGAGVQQLRISAITNGYSPLLHLALAGTRDRRHASRLERIFTSFSRYGYDFEAEDHESWTAAHIAASWASEVALRLLWDWTGGALNLTKLTDQWRTPFQLALAAGAATELQGLLLVS